MQVVADAAHLALHNLRVEGFAGAHAGVVDKASVVVDSFASHNLYLADDFLHLELRSSGAGQHSPFWRKLPLRLFNAIAVYQPQIRVQRETLREIALSFGLPSLLQPGQSPQRVAFGLARIEGNLLAEVGNGLGQRAREIPRQPAIAICVSPTRVERDGLVVIIHRPVRIAQNEPDDTTVVVSSGESGIEFERAIIVRDGGLQVALSLFGGAAIESERRVSRVDFKRAVEIGDGVTPITFALPG